MEKENVRASVHAVTEFALMSGDLLPGADAARLLEGIRGHQSLQSVQQEGVLNEVPLKITLEGETVRLTVQGRIDRLYGLERIEEIKTVTGYAPEEPEPLHFAQAVCYAHMLCVQESLPRLEVTVTYLNLSDGEVTRFTRFLAAEELRVQFERCALPYLAYLEKLTAHRRAAAAEMRALRFPYPAYRPGQRELAAQVYHTITDKKMLLAQAPTGTGKTMAVLFPALKALGEGTAERIFYLTARTTAGRAALDALQRTGVNVLRSITLYAKEKCCPFTALSCRSGLCPRQLGYYDRLPDALERARQENGCFSFERVQALAEEFCLCPFEFSLDLALECDVIVCDYNYIFDPRVRLQRFASGGRKGQVLLIDEAHNLPDRARGMYSAALSLKELNEIRRQISKENRKNGLYPVLRRLCREMTALQEKNAVPRVEKELPEEMLRLCEGVLGALAVGSPVLLPETAARLKLIMTSFLWQAEHFTDRHVTLLEGGKTTLTVTLLCTDAAPETGAILKRSRAAILFSATLSPAEFYKKLTGVREDSACIALRSPFPSENLLVLHAPISTRYQFRRETLPQVVQAIHSLVTSRPQGNFIAFFPSYQYLLQAAELLETKLGETVELLIQQKNMGEPQREAFLARFEPNPQGRLLGLCVLGGVFAEGIDLKADRLCGAVVIGVGLPQVGLERDTLRAQYETAYGDGYAYAYTYPGIGRVRQAAGRIIRSPSDRGVLLLIDDRYGSAGCRRLLPEEWKLHRVTDAEQISALSGEFWKKSDSCEK